MDLLRIARILLRRWWLILGLPVLVLVVSLALERESPYVVSMRATILIPGDTENTGNAERPELMVLDDAPEIVKSPAFANAVSAQLQQSAPQFSISPARIQAALSADRYSRVLTVRATMDDEQEARAVIDAVRVVLPDQMNEYLVAPGGGTVTVRVLETSSVSRDSPSTQTFALLVQLLVAFVIGCGLAALGAAIDQRIHSRLDVAAAIPAPVLGDVRRPRRRWFPFLGPRPSPTGLDDVAGDVPAAPDEAFRALRATLEAAAIATDEQNGKRGRGYACVLAPVDGRSDTVAAGLVCALDAADEPVLAMTVPGTHSDESGTEAGERLTAWLVSDGAGEPPLPRDAHGAARLSLGRRPGEDLMRPGRWGSLLCAARERYAWIIISVPDMKASADVLTLARLVDGVVLIVVPGKTEASALVQARAVIANAGGTVRGVVLVDPS